MLGAADRSMEIWDPHLDIANLVDLVLSNGERSPKLEAEDEDQLEAIPAQPDRSEAYRAWLGELYRSMDSLSAGAMAVNDAGMCGKLMELLKMVTAELELQLASADGFSSPRCESRFWRSVRAMANGCAFGFDDLMKVCNFPVAAANCLGPMPDFSMPGLIDHAPSSSSSSSALEERLPSDPDSMQQQQQQQMMMMMMSKYGKWDSISSPHTIQPHSLVHHDPGEHASLGDEEAHDAMMQLVAYPGAFEEDVNGAEGMFAERFASMGEEASCSLCRQQQVPEMQALPMTMSMSMSVSVSVSKHVESTRTSRFPAVLPGKCKRRIQRHRRRLTNYDRLLSSFHTAASSPWPSMNPLALPNHMTATCSDLLLAKSFDSGGDTELQFLLQKELKPSDVGSLGRIILPKRQAEEKLPHLDAKEGVIIAFEDLQSSQIWNLRFRFWPNNKTRMYLLECTGNYVKSHHLQKGDFIVLYRNPFTGNYMINSKKTEKSEMPSVESEEVSCKDMASGLELIDCPTTMQDEPLLAAKEGLDDEIKIPDTISTDIVDMEDPYDLIRGLSTFEADERTIDEIFNFD